MTRATPGCCIQGRSSSLHKKDWVLLLSTRSVWPDEHMNPGASLRISQKLRYSFASGVENRNFDSSCDGPPNRDGDSGRSLRVRVFTPAAFRNSAPLRSVLTDNALDGSPSRCNESCGGSRYESHVCVANLQGELHHNGTPRIFPRGCPASHFNPNWRGSPRYSRPVSGTLSCRFMAIGRYSPRPIAHTSGLVQHPPHLISVPVSFQ